LDGYILLGHLCDCLGRSGCLGSSSLRRNSLRCLVVGVLVLVVLILNLLDLCSIPGVDLLSLQSHSTGLAGRRRIVMIALIKDDALALLHRSVQGIPRLGLVAWGLLGVLGPLGVLIVLVVALGNHG